jgi:hypothetical protein
VAAERTFEFDAIGQYLTVTADRFPELRVVVEYADLGEVTDYEKT